jgi:hypothetical protein
MLDLHVLQSELVDCKQLKGKACHSKVAHVGRTIYSTALTTLCV